MTGHKSDDSKPAETKPAQKAVPKIEPKGSPADWLGLTSSKEEEEVYLGMENNLDPNSLLKSRLEGIYLLRGIILVLCKCVFRERKALLMSKTQVSHSTHYNIINIQVDGVYRIELSNAFDVYRMESPAFGGKSLRSDDRDLFKTPTRNTG